MPQRKICTKRSLAVCIAAGSALAHARIARDYSYHFVASCVGFSHKTIIDMEHARTGIDLNKTLMLIDFYGIDIEDFVKMIRERMVCAERMAEARWNREDN